MYDIIEGYRFDKITHTIAVTDAKKAFDAYKQRLLQINQYVCECNTITLILRVTEFEKHYSLSGLKEVDHSVYTVMEMWCIEEDVVVFC